MKRLFFTLALLAATAAGTRADSILDDAAPNKWIKPILPETLPKLDLPDYIKNSPVDLAEAQLFAGGYKLSLLTLSKAGNVDAVRAARIRGQALWAMGRTDEAIAALTDPKAASDPTAQVLHARILDSTNKPGPAIELLKTIIQGHPDSIAAHYYLGFFSEKSGDLREARDQYEWFVAPPHDFLTLWQGQGDRAFDNAEDVTLIAQALDRWATLDGKYKDAVRLHSTILNMFVKAYDVIDRSYWPAHVAAAKFLIRHDNYEKALEELDKANAGNQRSAEIDSLVGQVMLLGRKFEMVESVIQSMRDVDPKSIEADLLQARLDLATAHRAAGEAMLNTVLTHDPHRLEALGLMAGLSLARNQPQEADRFFKLADESKANQADAYVEAGRLLYSWNQSKGAIDLFKIAIDRAPWEAQPRNVLGDLYFHAGENDLARATLEAAYALEPFNPTTVNYLRLMDETAKFLRFETDHFIFVYAPQDDPIVPLYFAPYMESAYHEVCDEFHFQPPQKTIIQIYPDSQSFSVGMTGMPGVETFAATFGRLIVAAAPRAGQNIGAFNWGRVLKHEFAHVVHITMTDGRVPRWLTEGLAVWSEHVEYRFEWVPPAMYKLATAHKLFSVSKMNQVYIRPSGQDGEIAYMTGFWMSRYLIATYGPESIGKLLSAYKQGKEDDAAFQEAVGQPLSVVEPAFGDWAAKQVASWGYDKDTAAKFKTAFDHGETLLKEGKLQDAVPLFQQASKLQPMNPQPHRRLAGIDLKLKHAADALPELESLVPLELTDDRFSKQIAMLYDKSGDLAHAVQYGETAVQIDPYDPLAHDLLGTLYTKAGQADKASKEAEVAQLLRDHKADAEKAEKNPPKQAD